MKIEGTFVDINIKKQLTASEKTFVYFMHNVLNLGLDSPLTALNTLVMFGTGKTLYELTNNRAALSEKDLKAIQVYLSAISKEVKDDKMSEMTLEDFLDSMKGDDDEDQ